MGLDITAAGKAKFVAAAFDEEKHDDFEHYQIYATEDFGDRMDGKPEGIYTFNGKLIKFAAGSYHSYNAWRELLSLAVLGVLPEVTWEDFGAYQGKPFAELICMSDCEGAIASETSKKLFADFENFKDIIEQKVRSVVASDPTLSGYDEQDVGHWLHFYNKWHEAFRAASDDGFVVFR